MTCQEVMEYMQRQLDGDLNEQEADALTAHTRYCSDCADMFERLKRLSAELDSLPKVVPAYSLVDAIIPQLDRIDSERQESGQAIDTKYLDHTVDEPVDDREVERGPLSRRSARGRDRDWLKRISWPTVTGVAAAGLVAGLFLVLFNPADAPELKDLTSNSTALQSASHSSAAHPDRSQSSSSMEIQENDEVRIESTSNAVEQAPAPDVQHSSPTVQQSEPEAAPGKTINNGNRSQSVRPFTNTPASQPVQEQSGDPVANMPIEEQTSSSSSSSSISNEISSTSSSSSSSSKDVSSSNERKIEDDGGMPDQILKQSEVSMIAKDQNGELMGIMSNGDSAEASISDVVLSPDQLYSAAIVDGAVLIYTTQEGTVQLDSGKQAGTISGLQWSDDSKALFFEVKDDNGKTTYFKVDAQEWTIAPQ
ncbi:anti-sigma factor family protein [Paenibacillus xylaniclasticus]|uniref:anti-sigma factor family protein n=1 Tax=Paenibacillus xylaniclasticus TaxID=588083 RepID=UPI000FDCB61C|nr:MULTISPECIES: zf-HC2 domain-containing protein [Paenibacillus]GFN30302.1 hypothetical protein PCURB6_05620 [Paenibacillus curdlanolyticus]